MVEDAAKVRTPFIAHRHLNEMGATSMTELEMYTRFPGLCMPYELETLQREGYVDTAGKLTEKGKTEFERLDKERRS